MSNYLGAALCVCPKLIVNHLQLKKNNMKKVVIFIVASILSVTLYAQQDFEVTFSKEKFIECYGVSVGISDLPNDIMTQTASLFTFKKAAKVTVMNMQGVTVLYANNALELDASALQSGIYIIQIQTETGMLRKKIQL